MSRPRQGKAAGDEQDLGSHRQITLGNPDDAIKQMCELILNGSADQNCRHVLQRPGVCFKIEERPPDRIEDFA
jgi:hypothetical protein